jgi:hypothetical protein
MQLGTQREAISYRDISRNYFRQQDFKRIYMMHDIYDRMCGKRAAVEERAVDLPSREFKSIRKKCIVPEARDGNAREVYLHCYRRVFRSLSFRLREIGLQTHPDFKTDRENANALELLRAEEFGNWFIFVK